MELHSGVAKSSRRYELLRLYLLRLLQPSIDGSGTAAFGSGDEEREGC
jgi:hypothetical protein